MFHSFIFSHCVLYFTACYILLLIMFSYYNNVCVRLYWLSQNWGKTWYFLHLAGAMSTAMLNLAVHVLSQTPSSSKWNGSYWTVIFVFSFGVQSNSLKTSTVERLVYMHANTRQMDKILQLITTSVTSHSSGPKTTAVTLAHIAMGLVWTQKRVVFYSIASNYESMTWV